MTLNLTSLGKYYQLETVLKPYSGDVIFKMPSIGVEVILRLFSKLTFVKPVTKYSLLCHIKTMRNVPSWYGGKNKG